MSHYNTILTPNEKLIRSAQLCDVGMLEEAINSGADVNYRSAKVLNTAVTTNCDIKDKEEVIGLVLDKGVKLEVIDTLLSLAILHGDKQLISFCLLRSYDFVEEGFSLLYALQKNDCDTVFKLLNLGVMFSEEILEYARDTLSANISAACNDLYNVQHLNETISVHSGAIQASIISLEENILLEYNLCTDFFPY